MRQKREESPSDEQVRIQTEMAGSIFMELIGDNMVLFADIVEKMTKCHDFDADYNCLDFSGDERCELMVGSIRPTPILQSLEVGHNLLVPLGSSENEAHWIFIGDNGVAYNSYNLRMQPYESHQFCQSYALKNAYDYCLGTEPQESETYESAYEQLLQFWDKLIKFIARLEESDQKFKQLMETILDIVIQDIISFNDTHENPADMIEIKPNFPHNLRGILLLLKTPYAKQNCPRWE